VVAPLTPDYEVELLRFAYAELLASGGRIPSRTAATATRMVGAIR
jgi:hypothetical protein